MENIYFYVTGILTSLFACLSVHYSQKSRRVYRENDYLIIENNRLKDENRDLKEYKIRRKSHFKKAVIAWDGWHPVKDPQATYTITCTLQEIARSETNPDVRQFDMISVISGKAKDTWSLKEYKDYFIREYNGGWLNIAKLGNNMKFHWVTTESKEDIRDDKLEDLGI